jgi:hypothetical protein
MLREMIETEKSKSQKEISLKENDKNVISKQLQDLQLKLDNFQVAAVELGSNSQQNNYEKVKNVLK